MKITDFGACQEASLKYYLENTLPEGHRARCEYEQMVSELSRLYEIVESLEYTDERSQTR
jgi:hypothetical protein